MDSWYMLERKERAADDAPAVRRELAELLASPAKEEDIQQFLCQHPYILARATGWGMGFVMVPKFRFGDEFVSDFVIGSWPQMWEFTLVELEPKDVPAFKKDGTPARRLATALKQLADWNMWITENRGYFSKRIGRHVKKYLDGFDSMPEYKDDRLLHYMRSVDYFYVRNLVVIGRRSPEFSEEQDRRATLTGFTRGNVRIVSYDWIYDLTDPKWDERWPPTGNETGQQSAV